MISWPASIAASPADIVGATADAGQQMAKPGLFQRIRRSLAYIISPEDEPEPLPVKRRPPASARTRAGAVESFDEQLKKLLSQSGGKSLVSGRINLIGLGKIKQRFGDSWPHVAGRADRIARNTIEHYLVQGDIYSSVRGGIAYVIVFAHLPEDQARVKCALIGNEIAKALLGEDATDMLEIKTATEQVDGSFKLEDAHIELDEDSAVEPTSDVLEFAEVDEAAAAAKGAPPTEPTVRDSPRSEPLESLRFLYRPVWDQTRNVVPAYLCLSQAPSADGSSLWWDGAAVTQSDPEKRARLDEIVLKHTLDDLRELVRENRTLLLIMPLHFDSVASAARRRRYAQLLQERLDDAMRKLLLIEIEGTPHGVPQPRLVEIIAPLRPHCRNLLLRLAPETIDFGNIKGTGAGGAGCDVAYHPGPEFLLMQHLNRFARTASEKATLQTYLLGANSMSLVAAALGAGFQYIAGDAIAKPVNHPRGLIEFSLSDLYSRVANG
jgi:hypothetical protein